MLWAQSLDNQCVHLSVYHVGDAYQATGRSNNSLASAGTSSHSSSPPDSPYGSQYLDHKQHQNVHSEYSRCTVLLMHRSGNNILIFNFLNTNQVIRKFESLLKDHLWSLFHYLHLILH